MSEKEQPVRPQVFRGMQSEVAADLRAAETAAGHCYIVGFIHHEGDKSEPQS